MTAGAEGSDDGGPATEDRDGDAAGSAGPPGADIDVDAPEHEEIAGEAAGQPSEFLSLMSHLYRGSLDRATQWRDRLDRTVDWSVLVVASLLTWTFSSQERPHAILLLAMVVVFLFLLIEARRYRRYDVWRTQVRLLEENVFAHALDPRGVEEDGWRRRLSEDLRRPAFKISMVEAVARRLRRIYIALLGVLFLAWILRLFTVAPSASELARAAAVWRLPGWSVLGLVTLFYLGLAALAFWPMERQAKGHVRDREHAVDPRKDEP